MDFTARIRAALITLDDEVVEELAQHVAAIYASARAEGCDPDEAERRVDDQIHLWAATPALLRRRPKREAAVVPPSNTSRGFATILQDTRYAWRLLKRQPGYAAVLITTMALGISATTVLGSVTYGVLLKPLPWANAPQLVRLYETRQGSTHRLGPLMTNASFLEWRNAPKTLDAIGAWTTVRMPLSNTGRPERIRVAAVTPGLLTLLEAVPRIGRSLAPGDEEPGRAPVLLMSHALWQQRFGGRSDILGQTIRLNATPYTVVGVMSPEFAFPDNSMRAWIPLYVPPVVTPGRSEFSLSVFQAIGRLREGVTPAQAAAEGTARARNAPAHAPVAMALFGSNGPVEVTAVPLLDALTAEVKPAILILLAAVILLLVTATANAASLQLARAAARRRELAIRAALGAGRGRLVRQTLVENLLFGLLGGAVGLALAALMHRAIPTLLPSDFPRIADLAFDIRIQMFAVGVSIAAGLGCGLLPAWHVARADVVPALVEDSLAPVGGGLRSRTARIRAVIMTGQVAIAAVLLVGSLLLSRSFLDMLHADVGYDATNVLTATMILPDGDYTPERRVQAAEEVVTRLRGFPGVTRAAYTTGTPFASFISLSSFTLRKRDGSNEMVQSGLRHVSAGYFAALGQRVIEGREFTDRDAPDAANLVIVNREFARRYLEGRALGGTVPDDDDRPGRQPVNRQIIGVVEDTVRQSVTDTPEPEIFSLAGKPSIPSDQISLVVRTVGDPRAMIGSFRAATQAAAPNAPLEGVMTMEDKAAATLSRPRLYAVLLTTFAAFALAIAGVGLFGVLSYTVAQRMREIGVRTALGAQVADIVGLVLRQSMAIAGAGVVLGMIASMWLARGLQRFLFGVTSHDPASFAAVALLLIVVAAIASVVPARRAARVDPVKVLRG
jgi:putative ABC transport system permease protein